MRKNKIAVIGIRGIPDISGGIESCIENLAPELTKKKYDIHVYCRSPYFIKKNKTYRGVHLIYIPTIKNKFLETPIYSLLSSLHATINNYDLIHYHALAPSFFSFFPKFFGKKIVLTVHALDWKRDKWNRVAKSYILISNQISMYFADKITAVSENIVEYYKINFNKKIILIKNGIDENKSKKNKKKSYVIFVGRLVPEKRVHLLIKAFKSVKTKCKLLIVGPHDDKKYYKSLTELAKPDNRIKFLGEIVSRRKKKLIANSKLLILPSNLEGMPIVLLEASAAGTCPLYSDIPANLTTMQNHGIAFKKNDLNDLSNKLLYLISNENKTNYEGKKCKKYVLKNFKWGKIAGEYADIYEKVINNQ